MGHVLSALDENLRLSGLIQNHENSWFIWICIRLEIFNCRYFCCCKFEVVIQHLHLIHLYLLQCHWIKRVTWFPVIFLQLARWHNSCWNIFFHYISYIKYKKFGCSTNQNKTLICGFLMTVYGNLLGYSSP